MTTAATVWLTAAIGLMCGLGKLKLAIIATGIAIVVLLLDYIGNEIWPKPPKKEPDETEDVLRTRDGD